MVSVTELNIVGRGWDGISFTSVATASASQRYKDISLPLLLIPEIFLVLKYIRHHYLAGR